MKIALVYPGHKFSTFDVAEGHEYGLKELGHDVLSVRYDNTYGFYAESLKHWEMIHPGWEAGQGAPFTMASERMAIEIILWEPDIVLVVSAAEVARRAYMLFQKAGIPVVAILTDSPYVDDFYHDLLKTGYLRGALSNEKSTVESLSLAGGVPVAYLPHSYRPDRHLHVEGARKHKSDVFFFGTLFPERVKMFMQLADRMIGMQVKIDGPRPAQRGEVPFNTMPNDEMVKYYSGAKIALNHHRDADHAWSLGPRAYEIAACGTFQLCDGDRAELHHVFNGCVPTYRSVDELIELVHHYIAHPKEREEMAQGARELVKDCTFVNRDAKIVVPFLEEVL